MYSVQTNIVNIVPVVLYWLVYSGTPEHGKVSSQYTKNLPVYQLISKYLPIPHKFTSILPTLYDAKLPILLMHMEWYPYHESCESSQLVAFRWCAIWLPVDEYVITYSCGSVVGLPQIFSTNIHLQGDSESKSICPAAGWIIISFVSVPLQGELHNCLPFVPHCIGNVHSKGVLGSSSNLGPHRAQPWLKCILSKKFYKVNVRADTLTTSSFCWLDLLYEDQSIVISFLRLLDHSQIGRCHSAKPTNPSRDFQSNTLIPADI